MRHRMRTITLLAGGLFAMLIIVGVTMVVRHATDGLDGRESRSSHDPVTVAPAPTQIEGMFELTYLPDGFHPSDSRMTSSGEQGGHRVQTLKGVGGQPVRRSVHYNNDPDGTPPPPPLSKMAAFVVSTTKGFSRNLNDLSAENPQSRWTTVRGQKALVRPPKADLAVASVTWHVGDVEVEVVGRGVAVGELVSIAKGVRLS